MSDSGGTIGGDCPRAGGPLGDDELLITDDDIGKEFVRRDGKIARIFAPSYSGEWPYCVESSEVSYTVRRNGTAAYKRDSATGLDLIRRHYSSTVESDADRLEAAPNRTPVPVTNPKEIEAELARRNAQTEKQNVLRSLPSESADRKAVPVMSGVLDYFPLAIAEVARISKAGNDQHNPGQPLHWARDKSSDHADCIVRHLIERNTLDSDGQRHTAKAAWRVLALLQEELEAEAGWLPDAAYSPKN